MISNIGYSIAAAGFLVLLLLLFTVRSSGLVKKLLLFAVFTNLLWALQYNRWLIPEPTVQQYLTFDSLKQFSWILFLSAALYNQFSSLPKILSQKTTLLAGSLPIAAVLILWLTPLPLHWIYLIHTVVALILLLLLEILLRQSGEQRWAFKPLVLYLGAVSVFDFVTYANATMVTYLDVNYIAAKGYIYALMTPFLLIAVRRMEHWGIKIFISREIVLHSTLLTVAGIYLFVMAMVGYVIKYLGGSWDTTIQIVLIALSVVLLIALFLSSNIRNKLKVFISKNFFANQFDYREQWIELTNALATGDDNLQDVYRTALKGLANAVKYDRGLLCKVNKSHYDIVANLYAPEPDHLHDEVIQRAIQYCQQKPWLIDLHEFLINPENYAGMDMDLKLVNQCEYQFILPIYQDNELWGVAVLFTDAAVVRELNWELRDYLNAVLAQVTNYVLHYEAAKIVAENAQFAAFNRMSAFVVHDLKNVMAQVDLILCNAQQHKHNPEFIDDTFETLEYTQARMQKMLKQLTDKQLITEQTQQAVDLSTILNIVINKKCATLQPFPQFSTATTQLVAANAEKLSNVFYHLISNAQQATPDDGSVAITVSDATTPGMIQIDIIDSGEGMTPEFIDHRLFKPFDTTKGNAGMGIGAYDAKQYIEEIGGKLTVQSRENLGSTFTLLLPIYST
ncbi:MAG: XrtA/PEP-CTERM system histidine kinase PrsK [Glaciecola sp.]|jgi:putative PEP-CTERM system histidine kinase|nr:PEP-CTERM system histidine kinase PrsK [Glaciecola sp.]